MSPSIQSSCFFFFFQAEDGIRDWSVTGVQTCALPIFIRQFFDRPRESVPTAFLFLVLQISHHRSGGIFPAILLSFLYETSPYLPQTLLETCHPGAFSCDRQSGVFAPGSTDFPAHHRQLR